MKNPLASHESMGSEVHLSGTAVKSRIAQLEKIGVLAGYEALPAPHIFNRHARYFLFRSMNSVDAFDLAMKNDSVIACNLLYDNALIILTYSEEPHPSAPAEITDLLGPQAFETSPVFSNRENYLGKISVTDLKILKSLVENPRTPLKRLAEETGYSLKTARLARARLIGNGLVRISPLLQSALSQGLQFCGFAVLAQKFSDLEPVKQSVPNSVVTGYLENPPGMILHGWTDSLGEMMKVDRRIRALAGITYVLILINARHEFSRHRLTVWIEDLIQKM